MLSPEAGDLEALQAAKPFSAAPGGDVHERTVSFFEGLARPLQLEDDPAGDPSLRSLGVRVSSGSQCNIHPDARPDWGGRGEDSVSAGLLAKSCGTGAQKDEAPGGRGLVQGLWGKPSWWGGLRLPAKGATIILPYECCAGVKQDDC